MKILLSIIGFIAVACMMWAAFVLIMDMAINRPWRKLKTKRNKENFDQL